MTRKFLSAIAACAIAFSAAPVMAQEAAPPAAAAPSAPAPAATPAPAPTAALPDANPALWVVRDADTTIYLFGTIHLLDGRPWFNDEVRTAFDASSELVMEVILPETPAAAAPLIMRYAVDSGHKLSDRLTPAQNAALGRALTAAGLPATAFDRFKPWFAAMTLEVLGAQRLGISSESGPETVFTNAAHARHMPIGELEGLEQQIRMLDSMPPAQQLAMLDDTLTNNDELTSKLAPILAAWSRGDVAEMSRLLEEEEGDTAADRALHTLLFTNRNANWATWIRNRLERPGTVFIAVGAGHLAGRDSVLADLRARGIRATRVPHVVRP